MPLSVQAKQRIVWMTESSKFIMHWGWLPFVLYLGMRHSDPRPSLIKLLIPLA